MKKKVIVSILALMLVVQPCSMVSAVEVTFTDGTEQSVEVQSEEELSQLEEDFQDGTSKAPEETEPFESDTTLGVGDGESQENREQIGDEVWVTFEGDTATISGTGEMWDFLEDGWDLNKEHQNPFIENRNITQIIIKDGITSVGDYFLSNYEGKWYIESISLGNNITKIGKYAFNGCSSISAIILPDGITELGDRCFNMCNKLEEINMPDSITKIGEWCFDGCSSITNIKFSNGLTEIPKYSFNGCTQLKSVNIPQNIKKINDGAFLSCYNLSEINLSEGLENINFTSFSRCTSITEFYIPKSVKSIGSLVFQGCTRLQTIVFKGYETKIPNDLIDYDECGNLKLVKGYSPCSGAKKFVDDYNNNNPNNQLQFESIGTNEHTWDDGYIEKEPTTTEDGIMRYTCQVCNDTKDEPIPKLSDELTITNTNIKWNDHNSVEISFNSNKFASFYIDWVNKGDSEPIFNPERLGEYETFGGNTSANVLGLPESEVDIYICFQDSNQNRKMVLVQPNYSNRPEYIPQLIQVGDNVYVSVNGDTLTVSGSGDTYDDYYFIDQIDNVDSIKNIKFEGDITYIGNGFFMEFTGIEEVNLPEGLIRLGTNVFSNCFSLKKISFPSTLSEIPSIAYNTEYGGSNNLNDLTTVIIADGIEKIGNDAFREAPLLTNIELPDTLKEIENNAFDGCSSLKEITLPEGLEKIGDNVFNNCTSLTEIVLPEGLTQLGNVVFVGCTSLEKISIPSTLETIPQLTYCNSYDGFKEVIIADGVKNIGDYAFMDHRNLKSITLPESIVSVGSLAFFNSALESIELPNNIDYIGDEAFENCVNLSSIIIPEKSINFGSYVFSNTAVESITWNVENSVIPDGIFQNCYNLKDITIPEGVTAINNRAFMNCTSLTNVSIPGTVTELGDSVFSGCGSLEKISIPKTVTYFGNDVFYNCRNLTIYGYRDSMAERYANNNNIPFVSADYKVVFKNNGRTVKTEYVLEGNDATPPTLDPREGYTLSWDGDYTDIQEDMIINAVWTKNDDGNGDDDDDSPIIVYPPEETKYTVTFVDRGKVIKTEKVVSGEYAEYPFIYRYGYELSWDKDFSKVTSNMTVNAVWTVITPEKVTSLTAEILPKSIRLSWDENEYTSYFLVYRKALNETDYTQVGRTTKVLWADKNAKNGTEYQYKVVAVRAVSGKKYQSEDSDIVTAKLGSIEKGKIYSVGKLNYKVMNPKEVQVMGLAKLTGTVSIPSTVTIAGNIFKVTSIADKAFMQNTDIINVKVGNSITQIGQQAFYKCANLEIVNLGNNVLYLRNGSFARCTSLKSINIPKSVKRIGIQAFYHCSNLNLVTIKTTGLEYIGRKSLETVPKTVIKVPEEKYNQYREMITKSGKYAATIIERS